MESTREEHLRQPGEEEGYRFVLPARPPRRVPGVVLIAVGTVFLAVSLGPRLVSLLAEGPGAVRIGALLFALPFALAGAATVAIGAWLVRSQGVLELTPDEARSIERVGPLRWTRRRRLRDLRRVVVASWPPLSEAGAQTLHALRLDFERAKPLWVGLGYPREKLVELAEQARRAAPELARLDLAEGPLVEESGGAASVTGPDLPADAPRDSDIARRELAGGFELHVPPAGVWKGSKGLILLGVIFALFACGAVAAAVAGGVEALPILLFALVFGGIGGFVVLASVNMGRRTATLRVEDGQLTIERASPFGRSTRTWSLNAVDDIRRGPSGMRINNRPVHELQVVVRGRKALGLLSQRDDDELEWIAGQLRAELSTDPPL